MPRYYPLRLLLVLSLVLANGCTETVGFLSVDLSLPTRTPELQASCTLDPRRSATVTIEAQCDGGAVSASYPVTSGTVSLPGVPLGTCVIRVTAQNSGGITVLEGQAETEILPGENAPLTVALLEQRCGDASCDSDGDGLSDADEGGLGTAADQADSDGDGLSDGFEVMQCCSDPLSRAKGAGDGCQLAIQKVEPYLGQEGDGVLVQATQTLKQPQISLGGVAMGNLIAEGTLAFGRVAKGAVLGEVTLRSGGVSALPYRFLFTVVSEEPRAVRELNTALSPGGGWIDQAVDLTSSRGQLFVLGRTPGGALRTVVLVLSRSGGSATVRAAGAHAQLPVALALETPAQGGTNRRLFVLLREASGSGRLAIYGEGTAGWGLPRVENLGAPFPTGLALEPGGGALYVVYREAVARLTLSGTAVTGQSTVSLRDLVAAVVQASGASGTGGCGGVAYDPGPSSAAAGGGTLALLCNVYAAKGCPPDKALCADRALLVQAAGAADCLRRSQSAPVSGQPAGCWSIFAGVKGSAGWGAPVVDPKQRRVYQLTNSGVAYAPLVAAGNAGQPKPLGEVARFATARPAAVPHPMVLDAGGRLYVSTDQLVRRLEPRASTPAGRLGSPFRVGASGEVATSLALTADGKRLELLRSRYDGQQHLLNVVLAP